MLALDDFEVRPWLLSMPPRPVALLVREPPPEEMLEVSTTAYARLITSAILQVATSECTASSGDIAGGRRAGKQSSGVLTQHRDNDSSHLSNSTSRLQLVLKLP